MTFSDSVLKNICMLIPDRFSDQRPFLISRQGFLYNLTFDQINSQLGNYIGKPLNNTMNLDELVNNVVINSAAEEGNNHNNLMQQNPSSSSSSSSSSSTASTFLGNLNNNKNSLSKKSIDEVWGEIVDQESAVNRSNKRQQPPMLGETTLEEFLSRAGVLSLGNNNQENVLNPQPLSVIDPMMIVKQQQQSDWMQFQMEQSLPMPTIQGGGGVVDSSSHFQVYDHQVFDVGCLDNNNNNNNQMEFPMPMQKMEATSSESHFGGGERKRRYTDHEMMEKSIERRQRRMIKNRESAARSRARKQAYTKQLEHDVLQLRETNNWLRRRKELQRRLFSNSPSEPKYQLRRTSSAEL